MKLPFIFFATLLFFSFGVKSQNEVKGKVLDSLTHKPIPYVNVYFAHTTLGTVTDEKGEFAIKGFESGKYVLTASFVGYTTFQLPIDFNGIEVNKTIRLTEQAIQLTEVRVEVDSTEWDNNFRDFKTNFLGQTKNASHTVIANPRNLRLYFDPQEKILVAFAKQSIEIENRALGYKVFYQLKDFQVDFKNDKMAYYGIPRFTLLEPKRPRELSRWEEERRRAYTGSFSHFVRALRENKLEANGFEVYTVVRTHHPDRPDEKHLIDRFLYFWKKHQEIKGIASVERKEILDSVNYYNRKLKLPKVVDSIVHKISDARELFAPGRNDLITYKGLLYVIFKNEREENNYTPAEPPLKQQISVIHFLSDKIKVYKNGYYEDLRDVFFEGYLGWSEKLAELLPQDYVPQEAINKLK